MSTPSYSAPVSLASTYGPGPHYANGAMPRTEDAPRERERAVTRFARFGTNGDRDDPAAVVYIAGQAVTVRVTGGALVLDVLVAEDSTGTLRIGDDGTVPVQVQIEGGTVADTRTPLVPPRAPLGWAVVEEREGEYAPPSPGRAFMVGDAYTTADQRDLTLNESRDHARAFAEMAAETLNRRDAEASDVVRWHVVALVPAPGDDARLPSARENYTRALDRHGRAGAAVRKALGDDDESDEDVPEISLSRADEYRTDATEDLADAAVSLLSALGY